MLLTLWLLGCANPVYTAPDGWPSEGCSSPEPGGDEERYRDGRFRLATGGLELQAGYLAPRIDCAGAVILIPPGFEPGLALLESDQARDLAAAGLLVLSWDPRGRGESGGDEDANGHAGQDDLAALARWAAGQDGVDPDRIVLASRSFGGALAAGALARHPELAPLRGWADYESPGWLRQDLDHADEYVAQTLEGYRGDSDEDAWWAEREPAGFMPEVAVPYERLQGLPDHALGQYLDHAAAMIDRAGGEVTYNAVSVEPPIGSAGAWDGVSPGALDPGGSWATGRILAAAQF